jgi:hypothetical protein
VIEAAWHFVAPKDALYPVHLLVSCTSAASVVVVRRALVNRPYGGMGNVGRGR